MSGLVGIINLQGGRIDRDLLRAMGNLLHHRPWYKQDTYIHATGASGIARVHLGLIDNGPQPYAACGGKAQIFLHGQLYNDEIAQTSPVAFVARLYEKYGEQFARYLKGSFLCVVIDEARQRVFLISDRLTSQPLFYWQHHQTFYFSPEIKSLLLIPALARKLNLTAAQDFLGAGHFTSNHTWVEGVQKLDSATVLTLTPGGSTAAKYWDYTIDEVAPDLGRPAYQAQLADLLRQAVRKRIRTNHTYGILLSGGYDSRGILGSYLDAPEHPPLHTITWGEKEEIPHSDCVIARRLAQQTAANHHFYARKPEDMIQDYAAWIWSSEGLVASASSLRVFDQIKERQGVELLFRGDTCLGRYAEGGHKIFDERSIFRRLDVMALATVPTYQQIFKPAIYATFCTLNRATHQALSARCNVKQWQNRHSFFYVDVRVRYLYTVLNYTKSVVNEILSPLLDDDLLDFTRTLPIHYRLDKALYVKTVTTLFPTLFADHAQARNDIQWLAAFRHSPLLQTWVYDELLTPNCLLADLVEPDKLQQALAAIFALPPTHQSQERGLPTLKAQARQLLAASPKVFDLIYRPLYAYQKWRGQLVDVVEPEQIIWRLLALKSWGDLFQKIQPYALQPITVQRRVGNQETNDECIST
ncbi:MAG: asparagine synthase-related protein [Caldilineaceae bacterium]